MSHLVLIAVLRLSPDTGFGAEPDPSASGPLAPAGTRAIAPLPIVAYDGPLFGYGSWGPAVGIEFFVAPRPQRPFAVGYWANATVALARPGSEFTLAAVTHRHRVGAQLRVGTRSRGRIGWGLGLGLAHAQGRREPTAMAAMAFELAYLAGKTTPAALRIRIAVEPYLDIAARQRGAHDVGVSFKLGFGVDG